MLLLVLMTFKIRGFKIIFLQNSRILIHEEEEYFEREYREKDYRN